MIVEGTSMSSTESFSFLVGKRHIVSLGGLEGRKTFFENKDFSVSQGFVELLTGLVSSNEARDDYGAAFFVKCVAALSRAERLNQKLPILISDTRKFCRDLATGPTSKLYGDWRVTDITQSVYVHLYRLIHRSTGVTEIAEDDRMLLRTLRIFETFERSTSVVRIVFPWLITPNYLIRVVAGARLYMMIKKILDKRDQTGRREEDALQYLYDEEGDSDKVIKFIFSALSSSVTMTGAAVTWLMVFLANSPEWQEKCRAEADLVISTHRKTPTHARDDVLDTMSLHLWESSFPVLYACLQETLRLTSTGTFFRKNVSGSDIPIGDTGEVIPNGSYAAYLPDHVHMDESIYPDPLKFDPSRFLEPISSSEKDPHSLLGWGSGRHLCAGMRLARLEINVIAVHLLVNFDLELSDKQGCSRLGEMSPVDRNMLRPEKPRIATYMRYKLRDIATAKA
ncbi:cytochrome P450 [Xylaria sp. FL1777]|nr:cytochrome P450 [Xylaria sp. FL1777]